MSRTTRARAPTAGAHFFQDARVLDHFSTFEELLVTALGTDLGRSREEKLHFGIGKDDRADVAPLQNDTPFFSGGALQLKQRLANGTDRRDAACAHAHIGSANRLAHVFARKHDANASIGIRPEREEARSREVLGHCGHSGIVVPRHAGDARSERNGAIQCAGVHQREPQPGRELSRNGAFSGACRAIDRNDGSDTH